MEVQVYWRDLEGRVVATEKRKWWQEPPRLIRGEVGPGHGFCIVGWDDATEMRLYNQQFAGSIVETSSNNGGRDWHAGPVLAKGESSIA